MDTAEKDMLAEFEENCPLERDASADATLHALYERNIGALLAQRQIRWEEGVDKKYALACMAGLGRQVYRMLDGRGPVQAIHIVDAVSVELPHWERTCPLPRVREGVAGAGEEGPPDASSPNEKSALWKTCRTVRTMVSEFVP
jgi:hypothetical protein